MRRNPVLFFLFLVFSILSFLDWVLGSINSRVESNPIFLLSGSMLVLLGFKILLSGVVYMLYRINSFKSNMSHFCFISIMVFGCFGFLLGIYTGIVALNRPDIVAANAVMPVVEKIGVYSKMVLWIFLIPYILNMFCFWMYEKSTKFQRVEKAKAGVCPDCAGKGKVVDACWDGKLMICDTCGGKKDDAD